MKENTNYYLDNVFPICLQMSNSYQWEVISYEHYLFFVVVFQGAGLLSRPRALISLTVRTKIFRIPPGHHIPICGILDYHL